MRCTVDGAVGGRPKGQCPMVDPPAGQRKTPHPPTSQPRETLHQLSNHPVMLSLALL